MDFGEAKDEKLFVVAHIGRGKTEVEWRRLSGIRPFLDFYVKPKTELGITDELIKKLSPKEKLKDAIVRLVVEYPREWDTLIDEPTLRKYAAEAFEFHFVKRPQMESRIRLAADQTISSLAPLELLEKYWQTVETDTAEAEILQEMAREIINAAP